ncbi:hypothetical protein M1L60_42700 [Actinoplanes sp. TRM 88003]|uniref:Uncharacterized protein n=1 Tax=Paractinoplanes aksuensis TaxID=2939490 RepID=A0ABT1E2E7_9ACTN|nr:hypothetical protein [Actinoplanes aksuensis]MCO8277308.1 hypothetical protein [Actinoplanes aksuensis]
MKLAVCAEMVFLDLPVEERAVAGVEHWAAGVVALEGWASASSEQAPDRFRAAFSPV